MSSKPGTSKFIKTVAEADKKNPKALHKIGGQAGVKKTTGSKQIKVIPRKASDMKPRYL